MSIELLAYSDDPLPVTVAEFAAECKSREWEVCVIRGGRASPIDSFLDSDDVIVGWHTSIMGNRSARTAAECADWKTIDLLTRRKEIGVCEIEVWDEPDKYNDVDELNQLEEEYGSKYVAYMRSSRVRWYIRLAAGRNNLSIDLAEAVLRSLLNLRGGIFVDPQICEVEIVPRNGAAINKSLFERCIATVTRVFGWNRTR